jgi:lysophospholipase L1-like esterase
MMTVLWTLLIIAGLMFGLELGSRVYHYFYFLTPFRARIISEYPYRSFAEKAEPPIFFRFKKGFHSPNLNINRFGLRGPEPAPDGDKKRVLVLGESDLFGPKLGREKDIWSIQLERILKAKGSAHWEILNGGNPGYNVVQHRAFWEQELNKTRPDILILRLGGYNDISQAYVNGSKWEPGTPWPFEFILDLERKSPWWQGLAGRSCLYFLRRRNLAESTTSQFKIVDDKFQWERCKESIFKNQQAIIESARDLGAKVALLSWAPAYELEMDMKNQRRITALQANWKFFIDSWGSSQFEYFHDLAHKFSDEMGVPYINVAPVIWNHPRRFELYYDLVHFNGKGYKVLAGALFEEIDKLGWWE